MSIYYIIGFEASNEHHADFEALMLQVKTDLPTTEGCLGVDIYQDLENPRAFTLVEIWESQQKHKEHTHKLMATGALEHILSLLANEPSGSYFKAIETLSQPA